LEHDCPEIIRKEKSKKRKLVVNVQSMCIYNEELLMSMNLDARNLGRENDKNK